MCVRIISKKLTDIYKIESDTVGPQTDILRIAMLHDFKPNHQLKVQGIC